MTAFGISPLGTALGPFGGPGLITVLGVLPQSMNTCVVVFDRPPKRLDNEGPFSGINPDNYTLTAIDPTIIAENGDAVVPPGTVVPTVFPSVVTATVDAVDPTQVVLSTDTEMQPGVRYQVLVSDQIKSIDCDTFAGPGTFTFTGRRQSTVPVLVERYEERYRDLDYILIPDPANPDATTQVYRSEDSGDIGLADNTTSLKKRLFRRITTQPGSYPFLQGYGVGLQVKKLAKTGQLQELSNLIAEQAQQEPDVRQAGATTQLRRTETGSIVVISLKVLQTDSRERRFLFEFPVSGS